MMGTINCTYETPCGWCTKWDKECDRKIGCKTEYSTHGYNPNKVNEDILSGRGLSKIEKLY